MMEKHCAHCGSKAPEAARFCVHCGKSLAARPPEDGEDGSGSFILMLVGGILLFSVALFGIIHTFVLKKGGVTEAHSVPPTADNHDHEQVAADQRAQSVAEEDLPEIKNLKEAAKNGSPAALMDLAESLIAHGQQNHDYMHQAASTLERLLASYPQHAYALRLLGDLYYNMEHPEESIHAYQRYLAVSPGEATVIVDMGTQYLALGNMDQAIMSYKKAIELDPTFYHPNFNLSIAYEHLGDKEQAEFYRKRAETIEKEFGKKLADRTEHPRLPEGVPAAVTSSTTAGTEAQGAAGAANDVAGSTTPGGAAPSSDPTPVANGSTPGDAIEAYFRGHPMMGPKYAGVVDQGDTIAVKLVDFPMAQMPPFARQKFDSNMLQLLENEAEGRVIEIRDAASNALLARYPEKE